MYAKGFYRMGSIFINISFFEAIVYRGQNESYEGQIVFKEEAGNNFSVIKTVPIFPGASLEQKKCHLEISEYAREKASYGCDSSTLTLPPGEYNFESRKYICGDSIFGFGSPYNPKVNLATFKTSQGELAGIVLTGITAQTIECDDKKHQDNNLKIVIVERTFFSDDRRLIVPVDSYTAFMCGKTKIYSSEAFYIVDDSSYETVRDTFNETRYDVLEKLNNESLLYLKVEGLK